MTLAVFKSFSSHLTEIKVKRPNYQEKNLLHLLQDNIPQLKIWEKFTESEKENIFVVSGDTALLYILC